MKSTFTVVLLLAAALAPQSRAQGTGGGRFLQTPCMKAADPARCFAAQSQLLAAMKSGRKDEVLEILKVLSDVNFLDDTGRTSPLSLAVKNGQPDLVAVLLEKGADPLARARHGVLLLDIAISTSRSEAKTFRPEVIECVRLALVKAASSGRLPQVSPLDASVAFYNGVDARSVSLDLLKLLLQYGADPGKRGIYGRPLDLAIWFNSPDAVRLVTAAMIGAHQAELDAKAYDAFVNRKTELLEGFKSGGADPARHVKKNGREVLFEAMRAERTAEVLEFVLKNGVNPDTPRHENSPITAIHSAVLDPEKMRLLLKYGANLNAKGGSPYTVLAEVLFAVTDTTKKIVMLKLLLDNGAVLNADNGGWGKWGALALARRGEKEVIEFLLDRGATLTDPDKGPVTKAVEMDRDDLALALIRRNVKVEPKDRLALVSAARRGYSEVAQALLRAGADPNVADAEGLTALAVAERRRDRTLVDALVTTGARASTEAARPRVKVNASDRFDAVAAAEIDEVVFFDPPRFALTSATEAVFALYGKETGQFEQVKCERSAKFEIIADANMTGSIAIGVCDAESMRLRELASAAKRSLDMMFELLAQGSTVKADQQEQLRKFGWIYEKKQGPDQSEVQYFPLIMVGHGILAASTVVLFSAKRQQAIVIQADVMQLCGEGHRIQTPLCGNTKDSVIEIAERVYARFGTTP